MIFVVVVMGGRDHSLSLQMILSGLKILLTFFFLSLFLKPFVYFYLLSVLFSVLFWTILSKSFGVSKAINEASSSSAE